MNKNEIFWQKHDAVGNQDPRDSQRYKNTVLLQKVRYLGKLVVPQILSVEPWNLGTFPTERWGRSWNFVFPQLTLADHLRFFETTLEQNVKIFHDTQHVLMDRAIMNVLVKEVESGQEIRQCDMGMLYYPETQTFFVDNNEAHRNRAQNAREDAASVHPDNFVAWVVWLGFLDMVGTIIETPSAFNLDVRNQVDQRLYKGFDTINGLRNESLSLPKISPNNLRQFIFESRKKLCTLSLF